MLLLTEKRKNRGQTIQRFLEGLPRTGHSTASLVPPAKVNHVSRPDGSGLIQEGPRIPASRSRGNADGVKRLRHTLTSFQRELDPGDTDTRAVEFLMVSEIPVCRPLLVDRACSRRGDELFFQECCVPR